MIKIETIRECRVRKLRIWSFFRSNWLKALELREKNTFRSMGQSCQFERFQSGLMSDLEDAIFHGIVYGEGLQYTILATNNSIHDEYRTIKLTWDHKQISILVFGRNVSYLKAFHIKLSQPSCRLSCEDS